MLSINVFMGLVCEVFVGWMCRAAVARVDARTRGFARRFGLDFGEFGGVVCGLVLSFG